MTTASLNAAFVVSNKPLIRIVSPVLPAATASLIVAYVIVSSSFNQILPVSNALTLSVKDRILLIPKIKANINPVNFFTIDIPP